MSRNTNVERILHWASSYTFQNIRRGCILGSFNSEMTRVTNKIKCMSFVLLHNKLPQI